MYGDEAQMPFLEGRSGIVGFHPVPYFYEGREHHDGYT